MPRFALCESPIAAPTSETASPPSPHSTQCRFADTLSNLRLLIRFSATPWVEVDRWREGIPLLPCHSPPCLSATIRAHLPPICPLEENDCCLRGPCQPCSPGRFYQFLSCVSCFFCHVVLTHSLIPIISKQIGSFDKTG
jgi:hypothetical protein